MTTVIDAEDLWMFYMQPGTRWMAPGRDRSEWVRGKASGVGWTLELRTWTDAHVLSFAFPGAGHALLHFWDPAWTPLYWYVNVEAPLRRSSLGFDTLDHDLDLVIEPDRSSWRWKDEDDVTAGIASGLYTEADAAGFRREAEAGLRRILEREPPFDRDWASWRPDPAWPMPSLPEGWDAEPPA